MLLFLALSCFSAELVDTGVDADQDGFDASSDCDDLAEGVSPAAEEVPYNGVDDDCNSRTPDDDLDGDGVGVADDCDDSDPTVNPAADEVCNGRDDDCDHLTDEEDPGLVDASSWYVDADGDGYGDPDQGVVAGSSPGTHVLDGSECDDSEDGVHPGAYELCDGIDQDCDGTADEDACPLDTGWDTGDTGGLDTGDTGDTGGWDTADTGWLDTGDTADTAGDSGDTGDSG